MNAEQKLDLSQDSLNQWFDERLQKKLQEKEDKKTPSMTIIATKGTLDMAYPPFILASTASALGWDVSIFFTFYGLNLLKKDLDLKVTPLGNPAMPMKLPNGMELPMSTSMMALIPGFESMASSMMKKTMTNKGIAGIDELRGLCLEADVKMVGCQMTADLFDYGKEEFMPEVKDWVGAASFLPIALKSDVNFFM